MTEQEETMVKDLEVILRKAYPYGHEEFIPLMLKAIEMHSRKNFGYAFGGDPLGNFKRVAIIKQLYKGLEWDTPLGVALSNMLKQFDAAFWQLSHGYEDNAEGVRARLGDVNVYSAIAMILVKEMTDAVHQDGQETSVR